MIPESLRRAISLALRALASVSERAAAAVAFRLFVTPIGARRTLIEGRRLERAQATLDQARREEMDGLAVWVWESGDEPLTVVLVHGWTSRALYMTGFVQPLREAGLRVVALDFPGHGESDGTTLTFDRAGSAVVQLADRFGPTVLVGHSFGASMSVLAAAGAPTLEPARNVVGLVLVAGANELKDVSGRFCQLFGLPAGVKTRIDRRLEEIGGDRIERFTSANGIRDAAVPTLLLHDPEDAIVPVSDAEAIARETHARLVHTSKLGHNRILYSPVVFREIVQFVEREIQAVEAV
ncbi:MAG: alpha/beta fold hydrolase [Rhodothermales bacterium]|nr:alpha/beta fold hydrolase [Rhodothermales bacterium]MBO6779439.1 alpha/beta fold hydrolase [Rhodothermales bacterium]